MAWTYSGNPAASDLDAVRFEVGDTLQDDQLLQDEEIAYALKVEANLYSAAARCCEVISRKLSREADRSLGDLRVNLSQRAIAFKAQAAELRKRGAAMHAPFVGGAEAARSETLDADTSLEGPSFKIGLTDYGGD